MSSSTTEDNVECENAYTGTLQNLVPIKGSVYAADGDVYEKLPVGDNGDALVSDSTQSQGLVWKPYYNISGPTFSVNLYTCILWVQNTTPQYNTWGPGPYNASLHPGRNIISFDFDTYVIAFGFKPRPTGSGVWANTFPSGLWTGYLNFDIVGWADGVDPSTAPTVMTPAAPHFSIQNTAVTSKYMVYYSVKSPGTEIYIPARTKFAIRSSFNASAFGEPGVNYSATGNLFLKGVGAVN